MKKLIAWLSVGLVLLLCFSVIYYLFDRDYLEREVWHYSGSSNITNNDFALLISDNHTVGKSDSDINQVKLSKNDSLVIEYSFYSGNIYPYLKKNNFSIWDAPLIELLYPESLLLIGLISFGILAAFLLNKVNIPKMNNFNNKIEAGLWYMMHPQYIFKNGNPQQKFFFSAPVEYINIKYEKLGIICARTWKYREKDGLLYSTGIGQLCWESKIVYSDKIPKEENSNGIYALRLGLMSYGNNYVDEILGIISLKGEWCEHADGILRGEYCEILQLIINKRCIEIAKKLCNSYGVPVILTENNINEYYKWLNSQNGLDCIIHNNLIMGGSKYGDKRKGDKERVYSMPKENR